MSNLTGKDRANHSQLRLLLAEQSPALRERFRNKIEQLPGIYIVGEAEKDLEALNLAFRLQPDVIVLSASLPDQGGFEVLRRVRRALANCQVILMSYRPAGFIEKAARLLGATAVCSIEEGLTELGDALQRALKSRPQ